MSEPIDVDRLEYALWNLKERIGPGDGYNWQQIQSSRIAFAHAIAEEYARLSPPLRDPVEPLSVLPLTTGGSAGALSAPRRSKD